jgi:hypothetical protein
MKNPEFPLDSKKPAVCVALVTDKEIGASLWRFVSPSFSALR